jgi:hypothetical protein
MKLYLKFISLLLLLLTLFLGMRESMSLTFSNSSIQNNTFLYSKMLTVKQAHEDIEFLYYALADAHPNINFIRNKRQMSNFMENDIYPFLSRVNSAGDVQKLASKVIAFIGGDHMSISPLGNVLFYPPFIIAKKRNKYFISNSINSGLHIGDEVLNINNIDISHIWKNLTKYAPTPYGRVVNTVIEDNFQKFYSMDYLSENILVVIKRENSKHIITVHSGAQEIKRDAPDLFILDQKNMFPVLTLGTINNATPENFAPIMESLTKAKKLILDLRNNEGGLNRNANYLYKLLSDNPIKTELYSKRMGFIKLSRHASLFHHWMPWFVRKFASIKSPIDKLVLNYPNNTAGKLIEDLRPQNPLVPSKQLKFDQLYILTNERTASAAAIVAGALQKYADAIVVGEETYGNATQIFGTRIEIELPNSKLRISFGSQYSDLTGKSNFPDGIVWPKLRQRGVIPSHYVPVDFEKVGTEQDKQLTIALQLAKENL